MLAIRCCTTLVIYEKRLPVTDDIVTRLRDYLAIVDHAFVWNELSDAADEIERLRQMLAELRERHSAQETKHYRIIRELETQLKAVRGE